MLWISVLFLLLIPVGLVALAFRKGEKFPRMMRSIYTYAVMVVALIILIGGLIGTWINTVNLILPEESREQWQHDSNWQNWQQNQQNRAVSGLVTSIATVVVGGAVFVIHGKMVKKS